MSTANATHPVAPEEIMALLDGELSPERAQAVSVHTECCASCQQVFASLLHTANSLTSWTIAQAPRLNHDAALASIRERAGGKSLISSLKKPKRGSALVWAAGLATAFLILIAISIPNLLRSRMTADEASSVGSLRTIDAAAQTYNEKYGHYPRSLKELGPSPTGQPSENGAGLIDGVLADGQKSGYRFWYESAPGSGFHVNAEPSQADTTGHRRFSTDQTGVISANNVPLDDIQTGRQESVLYQSKRDVRTMAEPVILDGQPAGGVRTDDSTMAYADAYALSWGQPNASPAKAKAKVDLNSGKGPAARPQLATGPMIARTVSLAILVKDFDADRKALDSILVRYNGYAANLSVSTPQGAGRSIQASLRIPASQLAGALAELKALGHVENENQSGEEVTQQHADLVARLKNSRETEQRLQAILTQRTGKISDVLEVEQEIARVRGEIEEMEAEQKNLEHRVDFATIDLKLAEEYKAKLESTAPSFSTEFHNALVNGYRNVADTLVALVLFFAEYGPILLFWALVLFLPAWLVWRRWRQVASPAM